MRRELRLRLTGFAMLLAGAVAQTMLPGCGDGDQPSGGGDGVLLTGTRAGMVDLPAGSTVAASALSVETALGNATPDATGAFTVPAFTEGSLFVPVMSPGGRTMLAAFVSDQQTRIDARTTAEVFAWFALNGFMIEDLAARERVFELLAAAPELEPLAAAIAAAVAADPEWMGEEQPAVAAALDTAVAALLAGGAGRGVVVNPAEPKSGLTVNLVGVNSIQLTNEYRRRSHIFIDRVSYLPQGGGDPVPAPAAVTDFQLPPVTGLKSLAGTLIDIVLGNGAFVPLNSDVIGLPFEPAVAQKVTYEVRAVGAGRLPGEIDSMTGAQQASAVTTAVEQVIFDMFLPLVINVLGPNHEKTQQILQQMRLSGVQGSLVVGFTQAAPDLGRKVLAGDFSGALLDIYNTFITDSSIRELVLATLATSGLVAAHLTGQFTEQAGKVFVATASGLNILRVIDAALQSFDTLAMATQLGLSNQGDIWTVDVTPSKVRLSPEQSRIRPGQAVDLTATAVAVGDDVDLIYKWFCSAEQGDLTDVEPGHLNEFESSHRNAVYTARAGAAGNDTVRVEIYQLLVDAGAPQRVLIGSATASFEVTENALSVSLQANPATVLAAMQGAVNATLTNPPPGVALLYRWTCSGQFGKLLRVLPEGGVEEVTELENRTASVSYRAGLDSGTDTVAIEVLRFADRELLASAETSITVRQLGFVGADRELVVFPQGNGTQRAEYYRFFTFADPGGDGITVRFSFPGQDDQILHWARNSPDGFWDSIPFGHNRFVLGAGQIIRISQVFSVVLRPDHLDEDLAALGPQMAQADAGFDQMSFTIE